jgi:hypothetical protein
MEKLPASLLIPPPLVLFLLLPVVIAVAVCTTGLTASISLNKIEKIVAPVEKKKKNC